MKFRVVFTLIVAIISYMLTVLINLILQKPLPIILKNGLLVLATVSVSCWLILTLIKYLSEKGDNNKSNDINQDNPNNSNNENSNAGNVEGVTGDGNQEEEEFSPMDPTVLEVEEENN